MNVLITSAGRRVSLVRAFQKELKTLNPNALVVACDFNASISPACNVADICFEVPSVKDPEYIPLLIAKCSEYDIKLVIPTMDTELLLLSRHREDFEKMGVTVVISSEKFIQKCRHKSRMNDFFKSKGIAVPVEYSRENYKFPMFIKPINGSASRETYTILSQKELNASLINNDELMFLEYIDHSTYDEYTCDLYYGKDHQLKCVVPRKRIAVRAGEVSKGLTEKNELIPYIQDKLNHIDGAVGCLTAQFFLNEENGKIYGIEINPRFGGGFPLT